MKRILLFSFLLIACDVIPLKNEASEKFNNEIIENHRKNFEGCFEDKNKKMILLDFRIWSKPSGFFEGLFSDQSKYDDSCIRNITSRSDRQEYLVIKGESVTPNEKELNCIRQILYGLTFKLRDHRLSFEDLHVDLELFK